MEDFSSLPPPVPMRPLRLRKGLRGLADVDEDSGIHLFFESCDMKRRMRVCVGYKARFDAVSQPELKPKDGGVCEMTRKPRDWRFWRRTQGHYSRYSGATRSSGHVHYWRRLYLRKFSVGEKMKDRFAGIKRKVIHR